MTRRAVELELTTEQERTLSGVLEEAQRLGFIGPGDVGEHVRHALGFARAVPSPPSGPALDLGSGGGLPGLVLAVAWPSTRWVLLDANLRRTAALQEAVERLDLADRVDVVRARAEEAARDDRWRGRFSLVAVRSFGPPAVVAECAAGFLVVGGTLVVSEPPAPAASRWPDDVAVLGLRSTAALDGFQVLHQVEVCPDRYPRRVGIPAKRPLF